MNFTREPIIETIVTPMEGYKLIVRSSKGTAQEEFVVDAVEVVSFGHSFFFRSLEKPKAFLVPISDYEILEMKETRVVLKNVSFERTIKIGGGREASLKTKEAPVEVEQSEVAEPAAGQEQRVEKKRERRRHRRRRHDGREVRDETKENGEKEHDTKSSETAAPSGEEGQVAPSTFSRLFPPPPTLISEKLAKIKEKNPEFFEKDFLPNHLKEKQNEPTSEAEKPNLESKEYDSGSETTELSRMSSEMVNPVEKTSFLSLDSWFKR